MKTIIAGSRNIIDYDFIKKEIENIPWEVTEIVSGTARGVDKLGEKYAYSQSIPLKKIPADWNTYGKYAGPKRNREMAEYADALIAIWDGRSRGTKNMIETAKELGLLIKVIIKEG